MTRLTQLNTQLPTPGRYIVLVYRQLRQRSQEERRLTQDVSYLTSEALHPEGGLAIPASSYIYPGVIVGE